MIEFLLELFLEFLGFFGYKKKKRKAKESTLHKADDLAPVQDTHQEVSREAVSVCAGCGRILEKDVIYELDKSWCVECYKTQVLKIKG
jgi:protein-arginine kinase activator protein McsA